MHRIANRVAHTCWYGLAVVGALLAVIFVAARLLLPMVAEKKGEIEALIARESGFTVQIEQLEDHWDGLYPGLRLRGVSVQAPGNSVPAVQLDEIRVSLQLLPLFTGRIGIHSAVLVGPSIALERLAHGKYRISGLSPIEQTDSMQTETFMAWLFRQNNLAIEGGQLQWLDRLEPRRPLKLTAVNLRLENDGNRHTLGVSADFPDDICTACSAVAHIRGNPFLGEDFRGDVYVRARGVDVTRLPAVIRELLPQSLRGQFSVELWSEWEKSLPVEVQGDVAVANLHLPLNGLRAPLSVKHASTHLAWRSEAGGFRMRFADLTLALHGSPWYAGELEFRRKKDKTSLSVGRIDLGDVTAFVASLRLDRAAADAPPYEESAALWTALKPAGVIRNVRAELTGVLDAPEDYTIMAEVDGLSLAAYQRWPGVSGVGGRLWATPDEGTLKLDMRDGTLALASVFRAPLPVTRASADLHWRYQVDQWILTTDNLGFTSEDIRAAGRMLLRLPDDAARSPFLALMMEFHDGRGANAARYYPARHLSPGTLEWMEYAFAGGTVTRGTLVYDGHTRDFPFTDGSGKFEIRARVRDGIYRYLQGWEAVTDVTADVAVTGDRFVVTGQGRIGTLQARDILVASGAPGTVRVSANVTGATDESLRVLREVKRPSGTDDWKHWVPPELRATGDGALGLTITVPIAPGESTRVRGEYRFLGGGSLRFAGTGLEATMLEGNVGFNENGAHSARVRARLLGDEATLAIASPAVDETVATLQGRATADGVAPLLPSALAPHVSGALPWQVRLKLTNGIPDLAAEADLSGLNVWLPAPLNRPDGVSTEKLRVRTDYGAARELVLGVEIGGLLQSRLRLERRPTWRFAAGRLVFHETPPPLPEPVTLPADSGLHVQAQLGEFDLDRWRALFGGAASGAPPAWLRRVGASMRRLTFLDRDFGAMSVELARDLGGWVGGISGAAAEGRLRFETNSPARVTLDLAHLRMPPALRDHGSDPDPRELPQLTLRARSLQFGDREFGQLDFLAIPTVQGWRFDRIVLVRPESRMEATGHWRQEYGQSSSNFSAKISSQNVGETMSALGMPDQIEGTNVDLKAQLSWNGAPADIEYASLNGNIELNANKGRFLQLDPGAARLFGVLDMSAIARYLTLDFTPIFGKGFAFDRIDGRMQLERGNAYTDNLSIRGPSARLRFSGRVDLAREDFNLTLDVYPSLSDSLTLGSLMVGGPQAALWTLIVQRLFKKQIEEGTRVTYFVKGPWDKPDVTRKVIEIPAGESN